MMKNGQSQLALVLTMVCTLALATDAPKPKPEAQEQEQEYVLMPAALWSTAVDLIERQQQAIEELRAQLRKNSCKEV